MIISQDHGLDLKPLPSTLPITANSHEKGDFVRSKDAVEDLPNIEYGSNPPRYSSIARTRLASLPTTTKTKRNETKPDPTLPNKLAESPQIRRQYCRVSALHRPKSASHFC